MAFIRCRHCGKYFDEDKDCCPECQYPTELSETFGAERKEDETEVESSGGFFAIDW